jgi:O-antigen/teichoic acid export membrane protein
MSDPSADPSDTADAGSSPHGLHEDDRNEDDRRLIASGSVIVAAALALAQAFAYLVSVIAARALGPTQFGTLAAMLALLLIGNVVALGLQAVSARHLVNTPQANQGGMGRYFLRAGTVTGGLVFIATSVAAPLLYWILNLEGWLPLVWVALTLIPLTWVGAQLGVAQGREKYWRLAGIYASVGVGRGIGGVVGAITGQSASSTLLGICIGTWLGALIGRLLVRNLLASGRITVPHMLSETLHASHALLALFLLTNVDVVIARAILTPDEAGNYGVGSIIAKVAFWLPQFVTVIAFPQLADNRRKRALTAALAAVAILGTVVILGTWLLPGVIVGLVGGPSYAALIPIAWMFAAIGATFALAQALLMARIAIDDRWAVVALWASIGLLFILALIVLPRTITGLATSTLIAGGTLVVVGVVGAWRNPVQQTPTP